MSHKLSKAERRALQESQGYKKPTTHAVAQPHSSFCPLCGLYMTNICKCARGDMFCGNGHSWTLCGIHPGRFITASGEDTRRGAHLPADCGGACVKRKAKPMSPYPFSHLKL